MEWDKRRDNWAHPFEFKRPGRLFNRPYLTLHLDKTLIRNTILKPCGGFHCFSGNPERTMQENRQRRINTQFPVRIKIYVCNYKRCPFELTSCSVLDETCIVFGEEGTLYGAAKETWKKFNPDLIVILSCCCCGIIGDDVGTVAKRVEQEINCKVIVIRSEGFDGDFCSGHEEAFKAIVSLMEPQETRENTINIVGARMVPTDTEWPQEIDELQRLVVFYYSLLYHNENIRYSLSDITGLLRKTHRLLYHCQ